MFFFGYFFVHQVPHITKARAHHQYTAAALYSLLKDAYFSANPNEESPLGEWTENMSKSSPTFKFWLTALNLQILLLVFLRAVRLGDFKLYLQSLRRMVPWFFSFDHHLYGRWLTIHVKDLLELQSTCPPVFQEFMNGSY